MLITLSVPAEGAGQEVVQAFLSGRALLGDSALTSGTVVLHRMSDAGQGEIDSTRVAADGSFSLRLPGVPNPASQELYFASVQHAGVMYFGPAVTSAIQLDSLYEIQVYDTLLAPTDGVPVALAARNIFFESTGNAWQITDVFQLRNDRDRTVVARPGGRVWRYPLPDVARDVVTSEGELSADVATYEDGDLVVRAALPPGERLFVVRYVLDSPNVSIPTPGETETLELLVREPAPPLDVDGMQQVESVELEAGETFRRYSVENLSVPLVRVAVGEAVPPPPVHWIAVLLALILGAGAVLAIRGRRRPAAVQAQGRQAILMQLARLDEEFHNSASPDASTAREYRRQRDELMRRLRAGR